jgi:hypothetical protein
MATKNELLTQLKRVVEEASDETFDMSSISNCAFGLAMQDEWFIANTNIEAKGFLRCNEVFDLEWKNAAYLFLICLPEVTKSQVIGNIDRLMAGKPAKIYRS